MSTIQEARSKPFVFPRPRPEDEPHIVLHDISWQFYEQLLAALGDRPSLRLTYDRGSLEIMTVSQLHERYKHLLDRILFAIAWALQLPIRGGGSATFKRFDTERGFEPDECYWIQHEPVVRHLVEVDLTRDPPFDLAIEVEVSRNILDRMGLYATLGIGEIWRFDGEFLLVYRLRSDRSYALVEDSGVVPGLPFDVVVAFVHQGLTMSELALTETVIAWVREHLLPDWQGPAPSP